MLTSRNLLAIQVLLALAAGGCATEVGAPETAGSELQDLAACPATTAQDDQFRAAATLALTLMKDEAALCVPYTYTVPVMSVLAPQRYRIRSSGTGIEFDPNDKLYDAVNNPMKAHLAIAQLDATVAQLLSDGLRYAYANTDGTVFPRMRMALALANYTYPGPLKTWIYDSTTSNSSHYATVSGQPWCGTSIVTLSDTVQESTQYSPLDAQPITAQVGGNGFDGNSGAWYTSPPRAFKGRKTAPWTPFNGAVPTGNPYLVVTVNNQVTNWATYDFGTVNCTKMRNSTCTGSIEIDPIPYAQSGAYYDPTGKPVGPQANPFALTVTTLYADASHAGQWATRTVNGVQQWGTFSASLNVLGTTVYQYVKKM